MKRRLSTSSKPGEPARNKAATVSPSKAMRENRSAATAQHRRLRRERDEAIERERATAEVLRVMNSSAGDLEPVFNAMVENALRLCQAEFGNLFIYDGKEFATAALHGAPAAYAEARRRGGVVLHPHPDVPLNRIIRTKEVIHIGDVRNEQSYIDRDPRFCELVDIAGARTLLLVPMLKDDELVGAFAIYRREVRPFGSNQIGLVRNFSAQAVIAIENARLFNETREALERQTATADILKVIASSPSDVQPVFDAIASSAKRLIGGFSAAVFRFVDDIAHLAAFTPTSSAADEVLKAGFPTPVDRFEPFMLAQAGKPIQIGDIETLPDSQIKQIARARGFRSMLLAPLMGDNVPIGLIRVTRFEAGSFVDHHVQLLQTFADQAVIAIENARLFEQVRFKTNELSAALQRQTATADVLKVISRSAFDLRTVLDALLSSACRLCDAEIGTIRYEQEGNYRLAAAYGCKPEWIEHFQTYTTKADRGSIFGRTILDGRPVCVPDLLADPDFNRPQAQKLIGMRAALGVPLVRAGHAFGVINLFRFAVGSFEDKQIELVATFADQAVIAIENVKLFEQVQAKTRDLSEALTYQTGSSNILKVIASSPTDVEPVLRTIVESACELCEAYDSVVVLKEGQDLVVRAHHGPIGMGTRTWTDDRTSVSGLSIAERVPIHLQDVLSYEGSKFPVAQAMSRQDGCRTILAVPMLSEGESIGAVVLRRAEVQPFSAKQIALLQTFADQAVIALGNARLFEKVQARTRELAKSLDELRAAQDRLVQTEKLASLGQLTAGIAHEIKNPLNFVNNFSSLSAELIDELNELLGKAELDEKIRADVDELAGMLKANLDKVVQHGKRADSIVKNMLLHSREATGERRPTDINAIVEESLNLAYHGARAEKSGFTITLKRDLDPNAGTAEVYPQEITRVLLNLISNGFYAAHKRKEAADDDFEPTLSATTRALENEVEIRIRDNGLGIPEEVKANIFSPFFTTKPAGEGTGLGLSMSHDIIVKQHGGRIGFETEPGAFTEFMITLPRSNIRQ
ncbi:GAF domain-containing protein [Bradyrhizobium sp. Gha]|uniref:GAF domain-containing protein n=1 Tax=Bradyrhizobium sp. Gha TaxID=1855318 RepID=UPI0008F0070C|nr:GAF domain-containing protein [Bradyrhizobium sp. Gha]SFJ60536.1 His Kinase A (phospho-acceptor) domain-containing protein [Bradyrhizobium sp. Gha]